MAHKLNKFDFSSSSSLSADTDRRYPWDDWFDGDIWQLEVGEDFDTHPLMMERIIRTRATSRKSRVRIRHLPVNGTAKTNDPTGIIILERTDVIGPEQERRDRDNARRRAKRADAKKKAAKPK